MQMDYFLPRLIYVPPETKVLLRQEEDKVLTTSSAISLLACIVYCGELRLPYHGIVLLNPYLPFNLSVTRINSNESLSQIITHDYIVEIKN